MSTREASIHLTVDELLRFVLYGVSVLLNVDLRAAEIERLFAQSAAGDSTQRTYEFHRSPHVLVAGQVDEYEPESVRLSISAPHFDQRTLHRLVDAATHASFGRRTK